MDDRLTVLGQHDEKTLQQAQSVVRSGADRVVLCADGHLGYGHPIGCVAAYKDKISLSGVGYDIGCGVRAVGTNLPACMVNIPAIMDWIWENISFGIGRNNQMDATSSMEFNRIFSEDFYENIWMRNRLARNLLDLARNQFGTVGSGNHYVDLLEDYQTGNLWIATHFGSRGLGHKIATHFLDVAGATNDMMAPPALLDAESHEGREYLSLMHVAGGYARMARRWVVNTVIGRLLVDYDFRETNAFDNHHNYCWNEMHAEQEYFVVRKGATPAWPHQLGFIGGSMGHDAFVVSGIESAESQKILYSTVHGAGRVVSRTAAKGKWKRGVQIKPGLISHDEMDQAIQDRQVTLRGADLDEAPQAYRDVTTVLDHHAGSIKILNRLKPIGVAMAGSGTVDPYKD